MIAPSIPANEADRIKSLHEFDIVNTEPEQEYDDIVKLATHICNIGTAHVSLIDSEKQWIKAKIGLGVQNLDRRLAFCAHTILEDDIFIVPDASKDVRFFDHPMVLAEEGVRFYAGMPLTTSRGHTLGSLCVIDTKPRVLNDEQINALRILSKQVIHQLELRKANKMLIQQQQHLQQKNDINNKLLSIIGHDVRSPLATLTGLIDLLRRGSLTDVELHQVLGHIDATLGTAGKLLNDLLHWAAGQQQSAGSRDTLDLNVLPETILSQYEIEFSRKRNTVKNLVPKNSVVVFDKNALEFVLRNLVLNANKFTAQGTITIDTRQSENSWELRVNDTGKGMNTEQLESLFDWRRRQSTPGTDDEKGSGLALLLGFDLLQKNGATLKAESRLGQGSTFSIVIPRE